MNTTTNHISIVLVIVGVLLAVSYCMPDAQPDYDSQMGGQGQQRYGRGRYGLSNYYARNRGLGLNQRYGRGLYSPSITGQYYSPYYLNNYNINPYYMYRYFGYYPGYGGYGQGLYQRYGLYNRNRFGGQNGGYDNGGYGNGYGNGRDGMSGGRYGGNSDETSSDQ